MKQGQYKNIWELSAQEITDRSHFITNQCKIEAFAHGLPISYQNELCVTEDLIMNMKAEKQNLYKLSFKW